jgi:hypothetical protein
MEDVASTQMKEETTNSLCAGTTGAQATFEISVPTNWKMKWQCTYGLFEMSSLEEGAVWHNYIVSCMVMAK